MALIEIQNFRLFELRLKRLIKAPLHSLQPNHAPAIMEHEIGVAVFASSTIYHDGCIAMQVICPTCQRKNTHTVTGDFKSGVMGKRVCHNIQSNCPEYILPTIEAVHVPFKLLAEGFERSARERQ
jgi:hypothetical protein